MILLSGWLHQFDQLSGQLSRLNHLKHCCQQLLPQLFILFRIGNQAATCAVLRGQIFTDTAYLLSRRIIGAIHHRSQLRLQKRTELVVIPFK